MADTPHMAVDAFVAVGSNIEPETNVPRALAFLKTQVLIAAVSTFYRTTAVDRPGQPDFVNGVIRIRTTRPPREVKFDVLRRVEDELGRVRTGDKYAPRTIDLDLIVYDTMVIDKPDLHLPDPAIRVYPFVAIPLLELACDLVLPDTQIALADEPITKSSIGLRPMPVFTESLRRLVLA
jgi:2-amino-4-hydroxy-6-hydroxymethyldihydropteridine diphosphokinase